MNDIRSSQNWANLYRVRGFNPLPSRLDRKQPTVRYAECWERRLPALDFDRRATGNIQVMCGRHWRLLVIDLDGEAAIREFTSWGSVPRTWITHSGGGGRHLWFRLPPNYPTPLPKAILWRGEGSHSAIERLCDQSLVMAPPSIHPVSGRRYQFAHKRHSPLALPLPADCPGWVLRLQPLPSLGGVVVPKPVHTAVRAVTPSSRRFDRDDVLRSIPDKVALARSWGVRIAGTASQKGWVPCHAIDREDMHPSAAIHRESGQYVDRGNGVKLSLFDLSVQLGVYRDFPESVQQLGASYTCQGFAR